MSPPMTHVLPFRARTCASRRVLGWPLLGSALLLCAACVRTPAREAHEPPPESLATASASSALFAFANATPSAPATASAANALATSALGSCSSDPCPSMGPPTLPESASEAVPSAPPQPVDPRAALRRALDNEDYVGAWQLLQSAPLDELPGRDIVSGYVALKLGLFDVAGDQLSRASSEHPEAASLVEPWLRQANIQSTHYFDHLPELAKLHDTDDLLAVATRLLADAHTDEAFRFVQHAAAAAGVSKSKQARVRALRAEVWLAKGLPFGALVDFRWLALSAPLEAASSDADMQIALHFPQAPLTAEQRYHRAVLFADAGRVEETERELTLVAQDPRFKMAEGERLHLRGMARYQARDFTGAADILQRAVQQGSHQAINDTYHAAQSLSRIGRAGEAVSLFQKVRKAAPVGELTLAAAFRVGSEWLALGEWQKAIDSHSEFLARNPGNEFSETAERERAVAWFATGEPRKAANAFHKLRVTHPQSSDASLYELLEAVSQEHAGNSEQALPLLRDLGLGSPLSLMGQLGRARLKALGEPLPELTPRDATPKPDLAPLPPLASGLESVGLSTWAEDALRLSEKGWLGDSPENRGWAQCQGYSQLQTARRRFVVGTDVANRVGFWSRPAEQEPWLWQCIYPDPFVDWVKDYAARWSVPPALVYAVMRQESGFHTTIRSAAQAQGLMQIIGPTAARIAAELGEPAGLARLDTPRDNIRLGVFYLHKLMDLFGANVAPTVAAYNAGPAAARRWENGAQELPLEVFIARIPYEETRMYVQKVLGNLGVYQSLYPELAGVDLPLTLGSSAPVPEASGDLTIEPWLY